MLKCEFYETRFDGVDLYRTYSDAGMKIRKIETDEIYDEAIDPDYKLEERHYEETNIPIGEETEDMPDETA